MGKKLAVCVGINAYGGANQLNGCVNDARSWAAVLAGKGFTVTSLIDGAATIDNIRQVLADNTEALRFGDRLAFTYSGHGTYGYDASGDESDARDEAICPVDCFDKGMLYDDELQLILGSRRYGTRVFMGMDSCHSGSVSRFASVGNVSPAGVRPRFLPPGELPARRNPVDQLPRSLFRPITLLSGCKDDEYSYDAYINNTYQGAFTTAALTALARNPRTYNAWLGLIRQALPSARYPQTPLLSGTVYQRGRVPLA